VSAAKPAQFLFSGSWSGDLRSIALGLNIIFNATGAVNFAQGEFLPCSGHARRLHPVGDPPAAHRGHCALP